MISLHKLIIHISMEVRFDFLYLLHHKLFMLMSVQSTANAAKKKCHVPKRSIIYVNSILSVVWLLKNWQFILVADCEIAIFFAFYFKTKQLSKCFLFRRWLRHSQPIKTKNADAGSVNLLYLQFVRNLYYCSEHSYWHESFFSRLKCSHKLDRLYNTILYKYPVWSVIPNSNVFVTQAWYTTY